jgi:hypothetical protein
LRVIHHKPTNTFWTNDVNWRERIKNETCEIGEVEYKVSSAFEVKKYMNSIGYILLKKNELPTFLVSKPQFKIKKAKTKRK